MKNTNQALLHKDAETICPTTVISAKEFKDFKLFLNIIKMNFNDFSIVDGAFRTYSNNRLIIVETGFRFFRGMSFEIAEIKSFLKSISTLGKKNSITVKANDSTIVFNDQLGTYEVSRKNPELLDNKYISDEEIMDSWLNNMDPSKLIISGSIPRIAVHRMKRASRSRSSDGILFKHDKNDLTKGFLSISWKPDKSRKTDDPYELQVELKRPFIASLLENHYFKIDIQSTLFSEDDLYLTCYFTNDQNIFSIFSTKVNDLFVNIYSKSALIEDSEER